MTEPAAPDRTYRIGIDVGGTFTKAVLIDNATFEVVGRYLRADHAQRCARRREGRGRSVPQRAGALRRRPQGRRVPGPHHHAGDQRAAGRRRRAVGVIGMASRMEVAARQGPEQRSRRSSSRRAAICAPAIRFITNETLTDSTIEQGDRRAARLKAPRSSSRAAPSAWTTKRRGDWSCAGGRGAGWPPPADTRSPSSTA